MKVLVFIYIFQFIFLDIKYGIERIYSIMNDVVSDISNSTTHRPKMIHIILFKSGIKSEK